ncbi:MAG: monovalent cation/H(+) antiporter subunit G [Wenzhouxiangellaceae bacterium]|nr:monovalent cation/H(+) antiporter subunit G [Wenzhouxiangellaceae bacterium]
MAESVLMVISSACLLLGGLFGILGGIGLLRFPDIYSRLHAAGITDTLCALLIITGLVIQAGLALVSIKLLLILLFMIFTAPTASHALARAALAHGIKPETSNHSRTRVPESDAGRPGGPASNS